MTERYYVGDKNIPWWVRALKDKGLIIEILDETPLSYVLVYKRTLIDTGKHYLFDGDFLEYNRNTGAVTIGYNDWDKALRQDALKRNQDYFFKNTARRLLWGKRLKRYKF